MSIISEFGMFKLKFFTLNKEFLNFGERKLSIEDISSLTEKLFIAPSNSDTRISLGIKCHIEQIISNFCTKFVQNGCIQTKTKKSEHHH